MYHATQNSGDSPGSADYLGTLNGLLESNGCYDLNDHPPSTSSTGGASGGFRRDELQGILFGEGEGY